VSSADERAALLAAFKQGGNSGLYAALQKQARTATSASRAARLPHPLRAPGRDDAGSKVIVVTTSS